MVEIRHGLKKKDDKINQQMQLKKNKEMAECSFKPIFMTKGSQCQVKNSEKMYSKFLNRISETQTPAKDYINYIDIISSRNYESIYQTKEEELEIQKKLYNFISNSERSGISSIKR